MTDVALPRPRHVTAIAAALSATAGMLLSTGAFTLIRKHDAAPPAATAVAQKPFTVSVPHGWQPVPRAELAKLPSRPIAAFRRDDRHGLVMVRRTAPFSATGTELARTVGSQLRRRFPGFKPVSARVVRIRAGRAFTYTFVRRPRATVQSLTLAGVRGRAYAIDAVVPAGAPDAARQVGAIIASFGA